MRWTLKESRAAGFVLGAPGNWSLVGQFYVAGAHEVMFRVYIQRAGEGESVLLCFDSGPGGYAADNWYPTLLEAQRFAFHSLGITDSDWSAPSDDLA